MPFVHNDKVARPQFCDGHAHAFPGWLFGQLMDLDNAHPGAEQAALVGVSLKSLGVESAVFELGQVLGREPLARGDE